MKTRNLNYLIFLFFTFLGIYFALFGVFNEDFSVLFSFLFLGLTGALTDKTGNGKRIFLFHFSIYSLIAVVFYHYFIQVNGVPFIGGGDDEFFYSLSKEFFKKGFKFDRSYFQIPFIAISYKGYIYISSSYFWWINSIGFSSTHVFHLILLNVFVGALIAIQIFRIAKIYHFRDRNYLFLITLFPPLIYYSVTLIRDSWIVLFMLVTVSLTQSGEKSNLFKLIAFIILLIVTTSFRTAHGAILGIFIGVYLYQSTNSNYLRYSYWIFAILAIVLFVNSPLFENVKALSDVSSYYNKEIEDNAAQGSLGKIFYASSNPLALTIRPIFLFFSPIPPLLLSRFTFPNVFLGIGNVFWYISGAAFLSIVILRSKEIMKDKFILRQLILILFATVLVSFTSKDPRHLLFISPLVNLISIDFLLKKKISFLHLGMVLGLAGILLVGIYIILKGLI